LAQRAAQSNGREDRRQEQTAGGRSRKQGSRRDDVFPVTSLEVEIPSLKSKRSCLLPAVCSCLLISCDNERMRVVIVGGGIGALLRALPPDSIHLGKTFEDFRQERGEVRIRFVDGSEAACDVLVAADGLHSRARAQLLGDGAPVYRGYTVWRGITKLEHAALL